MIPGFNQVPKKLEDFLFDFLINFFEFIPDAGLQDAIRTYVYTGEIIEYIRTPDLFKIRCDQGIAYFIKHDLDSNKTWRPHAQHC